METCLEPDRPQMTIWLIHIACWIPKATIIHSENVTFIAFLLQQWLHERTSILPLRTLPVLLYRYTIYTNLDRIKPSEGKCGLCNIAWYYPVSAGEFFRILLGC